MATTSAAATGAPCSTAPSTKWLKVRKGNHQVNFNYSPHRNRYRRIDQDSSTGQTKTTYYLGAVEIIDNSNGQREYKRQLGDAIETIRYQGNSFLQESTHYLLQDHLGSVDVIVDHLGNIEQELSFDAWGKRRNASNWQAQLATQHLPLSAFGTLNSITTRGYTGHEMVDAVGIIHMNGRIYDPKLGRFLQADPFIQAPYNTQSLNRYSYVMNNPLNATDPSGYFAWAAVWAVMKVAVAAYVVSDIIVTIGVNSGWSTDLIQIASFVATCWIGGCFDVSNLGQSLSQVFSTTGLQMGIIGGITNVLSGGKFGHGFVSAGISAGGAGANPAGAGIKPGEFIGRTVLGGTMSKITGGKFANGALTAAFVSLMSAASEYYERTVGRKADPTPGENNENSNSYDFDRETGQQFPDSHDQNVIGLNKPMSGDYWDDFAKQGGPVSKALNVVPIVNATAGLHDYWFNKQNPLNFRVWNVPTMLPAAGISMAASIGNSTRGNEAMIMTMYYLESQRRRRDD